MSKLPDPIRPLEKQFNKQTVRRIRKVQFRLQEIALLDGANNTYASELINTLEAGLLLSSVHITATFLESFARDLLLFSYVNELTDKRKRISARRKLLGLVEQELEEGKKPQWSFSNIMNKLVERKVITEAKALLLRQYYKDVRIPLHHGLSRRVINIEDDFFEAVFARIGRSKQLESWIKEESLSIIEEIVLFMHENIDKVRL